MSDDQIPVGQYMARGVKGSEQYAPASNGSPQIAIDMAIEGGEAEGATMTMVLSFSGNAPEHSTRKLRMLGWKGDLLDDLTGIDANAVAVIVRDHEHNGKIQRKMDIVYGANSGAFKFNKVMDTREKKAFAAQFAGLAKSIPAAAAPNGGTPTF